MAAPGLVSVTIDKPAAGTGFRERHDDQNIAFAGQFAATDPNQPPRTLSYSLDRWRIKQLGTTIITNTATGGFIYTPNPGAFGVDAIHFQAYDGSLYSPTGTFLVSIRPSLDPGHVLITDQNSRSVISNT